MCDSGADYLTSWPTHTDIIKIKLKTAEENFSIKYSKFN